MKKIFALIILGTFALVLLNAQEAPPYAFSYKATITKTNGAILANKTVGIQIKITPDGYVETFFPKTSMYGQIDIVIGEKGGLETVDWASGEHFLEVWIDDKGGENFEWLSTTQLLSVPYALYAAESGSTIDAVNLTGDQTIDGIKTFNNDILVNGLTIGRGNGDSDKNTACGILALSENTTGKGNTANGNHALFSNTIGEGNTAIGDSALMHNTTGWSNTAIGALTLKSNTTGSRNVANGVRALELNTSGHRNTANGWGALYSNTTGVDNEATGYCALYSNTEGFANTANGDRALYKNTTGYANIAHGGHALFNNTTGFHNIASGIGALYSNQTGSRNIAIGYKAGYSNGGDHNIFLGSFAGFHETESGRLFIDNQARDNEGAARTQSLIYGVFDPDPANQTLTVNGNVGIGTISPSSKLEVAGDINFTGSLLQGGNPFSGDYNNLSNLPDLSAYAQKAYFDKLESKINALATILVDAGLLMFDSDGNFYAVVTIGDQVWMQENLKTTKYNDGTDIPLVSDHEEWSGLTAPGYCWYDNDYDTYGIEYGALYNGYAVNTGNLCPNGWHMPTDEEWKQLEMHLGMSQSEADISGNRGTDEGGKLKETGMTHWNSPNEGATNESGFTALPGGFRGYNEDYNYYEIGSNGSFWSSTVSVNDAIWSRHFYSTNSDIFRHDDDMKNGFSVRCIKD